MGASSTFAWSSPLMSHAYETHALCSCMSLDFVLRALLYGQKRECTQRQSGVMIYITHLSRANEANKVAILSELLDKWYTKPKESSSDAKSASKLFCYCRVKDDESLVLLCSGSLCVLRKPHLKCYELRFAQAAETRTSFTRLKVRCDSLKIYNENNREFRTFI